MLTRFLLLLARAVVPKLVERVFPAKKPPETPATALSHRDVAHQQAQISSATTAHKVD